MNHQPPPQLTDVLAGFTPDSLNSAPRIAQKAVHLARFLQEQAVRLQTPQEKRQQAELDRMIHNPRDKATMVQMTDQAFRSDVNERAADQLIHILDVQGVPRFFTAIDRTLLKGFQSFGGYIPGVAVPLVKEKMHHETANVVLPAEHDLLRPHLEKRRAEGVRMNVNYLGEALLGEKEAQRRFQAYLQTLQLPEIEVISVKISTIDSQIWPMAYEHTVSRLCDRLELLFRAAAKGRFIRSDSAEVQKFVYLDMEEYRDMRLTADAFTRTLDRPGLQQISAGIALQAYIPDSHQVLLELLSWARDRKAKGGAPITIRIVKGANMEMEQVDASLHGWSQAPYKTKTETDANYKRMLLEAMHPHNRGAVRVGVASHNLFELAFGLALAAENDFLSDVQFEMLEGMANHQRRALFQLARNMLLYAPACKRDEFIYAIGYLVRRLDENTGPDNFLRHAFKLRVGEKDWDQLESAFLDSFEWIPIISSNPRRDQDRRVEPAFDDQAPLEASDHWRKFVNEPNTDFSLPHHSQWAESIVDKWSSHHGEHAVDIPLVIGGQDRLEDREVRQCEDPNRPAVVVGRFRQANQQDIDDAVKCASQDEDGWRTLSPDQRRRILRPAAHEIRCARGRLMGAALVDGGKTLAESDPEVSEAVDFVEFYSQTARYFQTLPGLSARSKGVVVVVSPWNFPIAIPCGGVAAALAAGNTVILKPASDTVLVAYELCQCFWRAGVSKKTLQFTPCSGSGAGAHLATHQDVAAVILTGGTATALQMLRDRPQMNLLAETGGKNATIVTALADRDQAIKNVVDSAFGHSGQKCSATSLLILEQEVYEDEDFKRSLCDAVESLEVGPAIELKNRMGPLIRTPSGDLEKGLKELEAGESWAVMPKHVDNHPNLYSPGVKYGVQPGGYSHQTEFFGPVLGVMKAKNLDEAIQIANGTGYGLTSGLESLDDREQEHWKENIRAGNLYLNRGTTGAIVLRQPFGGMGKSAFGPGIKAGGPNYTAQFMEFEESSSPDGDATIGDEHVRELADRLQILTSQSSSQLPNVDASTVDNIVTAAKSYTRWRRLEFSRQTDHFRLMGQDNLRRYLPIHMLRIRINQQDSPFDIIARVCAAKIAGCRITVSYPMDIPLEAIELLDECTQSWAGAIEFVEESDEQLAAAIRNRQTDRIRYASPDRVPIIVRQTAPETQLYVADRPVLRHGRIELLWYLQEQSICVNYHRYGNLGMRADEERAPTR